MYCGPLLLNINPGPHFIEDYLNLEKWLLKNTSIPDTEKKPHLYAFIDYIYESLLKENKDQVVNLLGQIGSGKTFSLVHIIEYLCFHYSPEKQQIEFFDVIHKSMQMVHLLASIFRQNNIESSSCGMLLKIGFDEKNKIFSFDLEANILDLTLPFSENGRSFSILHSLMTGASIEIKRVLDLPERESSLNFFRKFAKHFDKNTKERFQLNDYEIWTRFHSLLNTFEFTKFEVIAILQLMSFILLCNQVSIGKKNTKAGEEYVINRTEASKKLAKNFGLNEEDFIKLFGGYKSVEEVKTSLISLMKHSYFLIFDFIKSRIKSYLSDFFASYKPNRNSVILNQNEKKIKYLYFIDIPGEVGDQTLGGLITNLANECQNLYAGSHYMSVVEKLSNEQLNIKYFQPLHCHSVIESLIGKDGLITFLSFPFTQKNYKRLQKKVNTKEHYGKCCKFAENYSNNKNSTDFSFDFKFSQKNISFNYESLYLESKSVLMTPKILKLFESSGNYVIKSQIKYIQEAPKSLLALTLRTLNQLFSPLESLSPFVVYCLHSNNSLNIFFGKKELEKNKNMNFNKFNFKNDDFEIPLKQTYDLLSNSLAIPVLYWEWFGFHEWLDVELFVNQISAKFLKMQSNIISNSIENNNNRNKNKNLKAIASAKNLQGNIDFKSANPFEAATYMLSVLCPTRYYIIGSQHVIFKKGYLNKTKELLDKILENQENDKLNNALGNNPKMTRRLSGLSKMNSQKNSGLISRASLPKNNQSNTSLVNKTDKNEKSKSNRGTIINLPNEKNMNINQNNNNKDQILNGSRSRGLNYSRAQSSNASFERQQSLNDNEPYNLINKDSANNKENNMKIMRRKSMKVQCHLEIININLNSNEEIESANTKAILEAKNDLGLNLNVDSKKVNFKNGDVTDFINNNNKQLILANDNIQGSKFNLFNFLHPKKAEQLHQESFEKNLHATHLETEFDAYKKHNNVIIPKNKYFNAFKSLFDPKSIESFSIFDYSSFSNEIKLIQNNWRAYKGRMLYKVFRYCCRTIVIMQKYIRGWVIRSKFRRFKNSLKSIKKIQKFYKKRHLLRTFYATKIQSLLRMKMARIYYWSKVSRKEIGEESEDENHNEPGNRIENSVPDYIYQTEYVYEEVEVTDEGSDNQENKTNKIDENPSSNVTDLNQNNLSFSVDNSNNVSVNVAANKDVNSLKKKSNSKKVIGNSKDKSSNKLNDKSVGKKKKKKVMKLVKKKKLVPNPNAKSYEKETQKKVLERANHYADIISNGFSQKYLKSKNKKNNEKELHDVSVSNIEKNRSMDRSSIIGNKIYFNNLCLIRELEVDKDKRQILDILMKTHAVKGLGKFYLYFLLFNF